MDNASTAGATPPTAPVYPVFAAVAVGMTGRSVYQVIDVVGGIFEAAGAVFEGSPDAPGTLIALLPPSDAAAVKAVQLGLQAQGLETALRLGIDAVEVRTKKEQDARWQQVIDSAVKLQKAARTGEAIAGGAIDHLTHGAAATEALRVGDDSYLLLTGIHELSAVRDTTPPPVAPVATAEPASPVGSPSTAEPPEVVAAAVIEEPAHPAEPARVSEPATPPAAVTPVAEPPSVQPDAVAPTSTAPTSSALPGSEHALESATPVQTPLADEAAVPSTQPPLHDTTVERQPTSSGASVPAAATDPAPAIQENESPPQAAGEAGPISAPEDLYPHAPEKAADPTLAPSAEPPQPVSSPGPAIHPTARWDGPLVGRDTELADLRARFGRVVADRSGAALLVTGEPGSGRTRLVAEFAASLDAAKVLHVSCAPADGGGARWPLAAIVEALAGLDPLAPAEPARARLAELFAPQPDGDDVITHLAAILALEGATDPDHIRWALRRLLEAAAGGVPTLLHIDDADRAGAGFARLLADVAAATRDTPVLIVLASVTEMEGLPAIRLGPLPPTAIEALVGHLLGTTEEGVVPAVAARMSGSPLGIEQSLAVLTESGTLAPGNGRWIPLADLSRVPWPDTIVGAIRQRLQTLPLHELAVLGMAAVVGEEVATTPLLDVVPVDARAGLPAHLQDLVARGYLVRDGADRVRFRHPLLREATMTGVPEWAQAVTHERFGRHTETTAGTRVPRFGDIIGAHLEASCRLRPDAPAADRDDARTFLMAAAEEAVQQGDLDGAARLEERAAMLTDEDQVRRAELLYLAAAHRAAAAPDRPLDRELADAALAASAADDEIDWRVRLLRAKLRTLAGHDDALEDARSTADEAIAAFGDDELGWTLADAWALRGLVHAARAQHGLVAEDLQRAADNAAAAERPADETTALRGAAAALLDGPESVADAEARCRSFLDRVTGPIAEHDVRGAVAVLAARRGAFDEARDAIATSIAALEELGAMVETAVALHRAAQIEVLAGQPQAAEPLMQRALAAATHTRDDRLRARLAASYAHVVLEDDRLDEALALADVAEAHAGDLTTQVGWRTARARVTVRRGRGALAERLVREGVGIAEQTDSTDLRASALVWAADVRRHAGRPAEAEPLERRALRLFERRGATAQAASVRARLAPMPEQPAPNPPMTAPPAEPQPEPDASSIAAPAVEPATDDPVPSPADGGATRLADEMMAMFSDPQPMQPTPQATPPEAVAPAQTSDSFESPERPSAEIDPADELLNDPLVSAEEESKRRWFNR